MKHTIHFEWIDEDGDNRYGSEDRDFPAEKFFDALEDVFRRYGLSISHEDHHGGFIIVPFCDDKLRWLKDASFTEESYQQVVNREKYKAKGNGYVEVDDVRIYAPENHLPVWGTYKDEDGTVLTCLTFTYQKPYEVKFSYTDPDGKVHDTYDKAIANFTEWFVSHLTIDDTKHISRKEIEKEIATEQISQALADQEYFTMFKEAGDASEGFGLQWHGPYEKDLDGNN